MTSGSAVIAAVLSLSACGAVDGETSTSATSSQPVLADFGPCDDMSPDIVERRGLEMLGGYRSENVIGGEPGRVCRYLNSTDGYALLIATTAAELGYPEIAYKETFEPVRIGGRDAVQNGPQTGSSDVYKCRLLVDMAVGGLWFLFTRHSVHPGDPCADLAEIATEVVITLPPGS
ncbi:DUF3558 family protein [Nocardia jiangsuensis]|uniref:DUF3558 family protein n=1 Tax=Nocardia jiangsuensis TaxID=1691563 RepID=A0ABV8E058_9NOCA